MPTITEMLLPEFDAEMASTRKLLAAVPEEKFDWRPHAKSFTMGRLAGHVAELLSWTGDVLRGDRFDVDAANPPENASSSLRTSSRCWRDSTNGRRGRALILRRQPMRRCSRNL